MKPFRFVFISGCSGFLLVLVENWYPPTIGVFLEVILTKQRLQKIQFRQRFALET